MTSSSHLASSTLAYLVTAALLESDVSIQGVVMTAAGSLMPDIDTPTSSMGRPFYPLASWIHCKVGHRTLTHSLLGTSLFAILVWGVVWFLSPWLEGWLLSDFGWHLVLGYLSHIVVDTLNKTGVELFWPSRVRCVLFYNERYRIATAGSGDYWFMSLCLVLNLGLYPLARDGFKFSLHQAFGDIYSVSLDFKEWGDKNQIWLDLEGVEHLSNQKVKGHFEILAALDNGAVLIERQGLKQIVSRTHPFHIFPHRVKISIGEKQNSTTHEIDLAGRTLADIPPLADATRVLLYGYLTPIKLPKLSLYEDRYNPISLRLDKLHLKHAGPADIREQNIQHLLIREGKLILRTQRQPETTPQPLQLLKPAARIGHIEIRLRPEDHVLLAEGQLIQFGQVLAREDMSIRVENLEEEYRSDLLRLNQQLTELQMQLLQVQGHSEGMETQRQRLQAELSRLGSQPLFIKEYARLQQLLISTAAQAQEAGEKLEMLRLRKQHLRARIEARSKRLVEDSASLVRQAEILSSFAGRILRITQEPEDQAVVYSVLYERSSGSNLLKSRPLP